MRRIIRSRLGSTPRFSQPSSGFLARPNLRPYCMPQPFIGSPYSPELSPRQRSCASLETTSSPAVIDRRDPSVTIGSVHQRFQRTSAAKAAAARIPRRLWVPFQKHPKMQPPGRPENQTNRPKPNRSLYFSFIRFEAFFPSRVRS